MLQGINRVFIILVMLAVLAGIIFSIAALFLPMLLVGNEYEHLSKMEHRSDFSISSDVENIHPGDSPYTFNITINTPRLQKKDLVFLDVYSDGKHISSIDCLVNYESYDDYAGLKHLNCSTQLPYDYQQKSNYKVFAILTRDGTDYSADPIDISSDWHEYEVNFANLSWLMAFAVVFIYLIFLLPITLLLFYVSLKTFHASVIPQQYSFRSLFFPLNFGRTILQKIHSVLLSPYFWAFEGVGISIIFIYMGLAAEIWKSSTAVVSFFLSGLFAIIVPYLWCAAWWYADFKEREPIRIIITLFLWGMLSALMAIGFNSIADGVLAIFGLGFLSVFIVAPIVEEFYKGSGLCLLSEHSRYASVERGIVFGFVIGMGFSFIENWIYFIGNPLGSDTWSWFILFLLRSVFFSANHGFYTAITGAVIGYLVERKFKAPALGLLVGFPIAAVFHAIHNSGAVLSALLGGLGTIFYCCFLIPVFDYGGFVILVLLFVRALFRNKRQGTCRNPNSVSFRSHTAQKNIPS